MHLRTNKDSAMGPTSLHIRDSHVIRSAGHVTGVVHTASHSFVIEVIREPVTRNRKAFVMYVGVCCL